MVRTPIIDLSYNLMISLQRGNKVANGGDSWKVQLHGTHWLQVHGQKVGPKAARGKKRIKLATWEAGNQCETLEGESWVLSGMNWCH